MCLRLFTVEGRGLSVAVGEVRREIWRRVISVCRYNPPPLPHAIEERKVQDVSVSGDNRRSMLLE
jgi:hypothetical protein